MTVSANETALHKEWRLFWELSARLRDTLLNRLFDLRPEKAQRRASYLFVLFLASGFAVSLLYYPLSEWARHVGDVLTAMLSTTSTPEQLNAAIDRFLLFLRTVTFDARILQYLPVFLAPFFIALQSAAMYLADIFELEDVSVARRFIGSVALSGSDESIQIKHGEIAEESRLSPVFLIGGPGKVVVELDSVALFERADGTPHIIGPTGKETGGKASLQGFERFRQALDIRDHYVELRDQDEKSKAVKSRSRDGIPIKATDVRLMYSIFRGNNPEPSKEQPYRFSRDAVEQIIFKAASRVTPEKPYPSTFEFTWVNNMVGLIRSQLGNFMSKHNLTEYLASIGLPEIEKAAQREETIRREMRELTQSDDHAEAKEIKSPPDFQARYKIKDLFAQFAEEFTSKARENGVELHWIGIGTWESMVKVVPDKHLKAWLLTQENLKNDSPEEMKKVEQQEIVDKLTELIQKVPLDAFEAIRTSPRSGRHDFNVQALLLEYKNSLQETVDLIESKNKIAPQNILEAIKYINNLIGHWAGS